jgi:hypothetical protein
MREEPAMNVVEPRDQFVCLFHSGIAAAKQPICYGFESCFRFATGGKLISYRREDRGRIFYHRRRVPLPPKEQRAWWNLV